LNSEISVGYFLQLVCDTNYNALGSVAYSIGVPTPVYTPVASDLTCVHDRCVTQCDVGELLWESDGNGKIYPDGVAIDGDASAYAISGNEDSISSTSFIVIPSTESLDSYAKNFLCIKKYANVTDFIVNLF
jgi:hypothetical protein